MNNKGEFITERSHPDNGGSDRTQPTSYTLPIIPYITSYTLPSDSHTRFTSPYCLSFSELPWWIMNWSVNVPTMCAFKQNTLWCVVQCGFTILVLTRMARQEEVLLEGFVQENYYYIWYRNMIIIGANHDQALTRVLLLREKIESRKKISKIW